MSIHKVNLTTEGPESPEALDELCKDCSALFFAAGFETQAPETIDFMVNNALGVISAAQRNSVGAVVLTSSGASTNAPGITDEIPKQEHVHWADHEGQIAKGKYSPAAKTLGLCRITMVDPK